MKISLITVTYNAEPFLESCIASAASQQGVDLEYIVIDGVSSDKTLSIIDNYKGFIDKFVSEQDRGMYDAINKGISLATGDVIGILNADDIFASGDVLFEVINRFEATGADIVYGDLNYVDALDVTKILRYWKSKPYKKDLFQFGWMPAHPTFYARKPVFETFGNYRLDMGSAADYELMMRFLHTNHLKSAYLPKVMVLMRAGGMSNSSVKNRLKANLSDIKAMKLNGIRFPLITAFLKPVRKIPQFLGF